MDTGHEYFDDVRSELLPGRKGYSKVSKEQHVQLCIVVDVGLICGKIPAYSELRTTVMALDNEAQGVFCSNLCMQRAGVLSAPASLAGF